MCDCTAGTTELYTVEGTGYSTPCWVWQGSVNNRGYGRVGKDLAHRRFYTKKHGEIADGMVVDHLCRTRRCVNPDHMEIVTVAENNRRGNLAKLTYADAELIRTRYSNGETQRSIARSYGVSAYTIGDVCRGVSWT